MKLEQWRNIFNVIVNTNSIVQYVIQNQKLNNKTCQCECKNYRTCKKDYSLKLSTCICENSQYLQNTSVTECDEIVSVTDIVLSKKTNITSIASINCHSIKVRDCYILHTVLLVIMLLLIIIIFCYHYLKQKCII